MAAPTATQRPVPAGIRLDDPHATFVTLGTGAVLAIWEKSITPPGFDSGPPIQTGTMFNETWHTMRQQDLITMTEQTYTVAYDPSQLALLPPFMQDAVSITHTWFTGDYMAYWGYIRTWKPNEITEGQQPTAVITIQPTNTDPEDGSEAGPVFGKF